MRMSKDNATFLNNPHTVVFSLTEGIEFAKAFSGGSEHMVASLVTFDAPMGQVELQFSVHTAAGAVPVIRVDREEEDVRRIFDAVAEEMQIAALRPSIFPSLRHRELTGSRERRRMS